EGRGSPRPSRFFRLRRYAYGRGKPRPYESGRRLRSPPRPPLARRAKRSAGASADGPLHHFRCCATYLFISNIVTLSLPNTGRSLSSLMISRRFFGSCRSFFLMYSHSFLTTCGRGKGSEP